MTARSAVRVASLAYAANAALGLAVASGRVRMGRARWVHHALYIVTASTTVVAIAATARERGRVALVMAPALVPLTVIPYAGTRGRRHPLLAASIAPFLGAGLVVTRSSRRR